MLRACDQRLGSQRAIAALFGVSQAFVETLLRRRRMTGAIASRPHAGGRRAICHAAALAHVRHPVQEQPEATLAEFCEPWWAQRGLRAHQVAGVQATIAACGARLRSWPPSSPDLSPIAPCWSKRTTDLRKVRARTREALETAMPAAVATLTEADARGWFAHAGDALH